MRELDVGSLLKQYRPELHYMRGPGPRWHEKHDGVPMPASNEVQLAQASWFFAAVTTVLLGLVAVVTLT